MLITVKVKQRDIQLQKHVNKTKIILLKDKKSNNQSIFFSFSSQEDSTPLPASCFSIW